MGFLPWTTQMFALLPQAMEKAFCQEYLDFLSAKHPSVPTDIRGFLKHCGVLKDNDTPEGKCIQIYVLIFINQNIIKGHGQNEINFTS